MRIAIEEMQVHPEQKRGSQPQQNSKHRTGCDPVPVLLFYVKTKVVDKKTKRRQRIARSDTARLPGTSLRLLRRHQPCCRAWTMKRLRCRSHVIARHQSQFRIFKETLNKPVSSR